MILPAEAERYCLDLYDWVIPLSGEGKEKGKKITGIHKTDVTEIVFLDGTTVTSPDCFKFRMSAHQYRICQERWVRSNKISVGSKVRVLRAAEDYEDGWSEEWVPSMDEAVGKILTVRCINEDNRGIELAAAAYENFTYPYYVLEPQLSVQVGQVWIPKKSRCGITCYMELTVMSTNPLRVLVHNHKNFSTLDGYDYTNNFKCWYTQGKLELIERKPHEGVMVRKHTKNTPKITVEVEAEITIKVPRARRGVQL